MDREFEKFRGRPGESLANRVHITIDPRGTLTLNKNLFNQMGKPESVFLHFSRARSIIALEPANPHFNESFPVKPAASGGYKIYAMPFCRHFNMDIEGTLKFIDPDIRDGRLYLNLHDTTSISRGKRKKK